MRSDPGAPANPTVTPIRASSTHAPSTHPPAWVNATIRSIGTGVSATGTPQISASSAAAAARSAWPVTSAMRTSGWVSASMIAETGGNDRMVSLGSMLSRNVTPDPVLRAELAQFDVDALAFTAMTEKFMDEAKSGKGHPAQPNMFKYAGTELNKRRHELIMSAGGSRALEWDSEETSGGKPARSWLRTKANSIEGGTSEVMLGVVAKRILELPGA